MKKGEGEGEGEGEGGGNGNGEGIGGGDGDGVGVGVGDEDEDEEGLDVWSLAEGEPLSATSAFYSPFPTHLPPAVPFNSAASESVDEAEDELLEWHIAQFSSPLTPQPDTDANDAFEQSQAASDQEQAWQTPEDGFLVHQKHEILLNVNDISKASLALVSQAQTNGYEAEDSPSTNTNQIILECNTGIMQIHALLSQEQTDGYEAEITRSEKKNESACQYEASKVSPIDLTGVKGFSETWSDALPNSRSQENATNISKQHFLCEKGLGCVLPREVPLKSPGGCVKQMPSGKENAVIAGSVQSGSPSSDVISVGPQMKRPLIDTNFFQQVHPKYGKSRPLVGGTNQHLHFVKSENCLRRLQCSNSAASSKNMSSSENGWICPRARKRPPWNTSKQCFLDSWLARPAR